MYEYYAITLTILIILLLMCSNSSMEGFVERTHKAGYFELPDQISAPDITADYPYLPESKPHQLPRPDKFVYGRNDLIPNNYIFNNLEPIKLRYPPQKSIKLDIGNANDKATDYIYNSTGTKKCNFIYNN